MATLSQIGALAPQTAEAMARKDLAAFGRLIDAAWRLNRQLDPNSSNDRIQELLARVAPHVHGAKLLGAGGGGFLLLVCKSPEDAGRVRSMLEAAPPNELARFFDFEVSRRARGLGAPSFRMRSWQPFPPHVSTVPCRVRPRTGQVFRRSWPSDGGGGGGTWRGVQLPMQGYPRPCVPPM